MEVRQPNRLGYWFFTLVVAAGYLVLCVHLAGHLAHQVRAAKQSAGIQSDLFPRWYGTHQLLLHHVDPYSSAVTAAIAHMDALPTEHFATNFYAFAYPLYLSIVISPLALLPFSIALILYTVLSFLVLAGALFLVVRQLVPSLDRWAAGLVAASALFVLPVYSCLSLQQPSLIVLDVMLVATYLILKHWYNWAGVVSSVALVKPQLAIPFVLFVVVWSLSSRERRGLFYGLVAGVLLLEASSQLLLPGWERSFIEAARTYSGINGNEPGLWLVSGNRMVAVTLGLVVIAVMFATWAQALWHSNSVQALVGAIGATTLMMLLVFPRPAGNYYDGMFVILPVLAIIGSVQRYASHARMMVYAALALLIFWPIVSDVGPARTAVFLHAIMSLYAGTLGFYLQSRMETASQFYTVGIAPILLIGFFALVIRQRFARPDPLLAESQGAPTLFPASINDR